MNTSYFNCRIDEFQGNKTKLKNLDKDNDVRRIMHNTLFRN